MIIKKTWLLILTNKKNGLGLVYVKNLKHTLDLQYVNKRGLSLNQQVFMDKPKKWAF